MKKVYLQFENDKDVETFLYNQAHDTDKLYKIELINRNPSYGLECLMPSLVKVPSIEYLFNCKVIPLNEVY